MNGTDPNFVQQAPPLPAQPQQQSDSGWGIGDPFSFTPQGQAAPPGSGWQHIAMFGGNMLRAANARTASGHLANGTGFAGPLGAATVDTMEQASQQALQRQQMQGAYLNNQLTAAHLPVEIQRANLQRAMLNNPQFQQRLMGGVQGQPIGDLGAMPPPPNAFGSATPSPGGLSGAVHQLESGGSMAPGITGDGGQAFGPMQVHAAALADVNKANGTNYTPEQLAADPKIGKWVGDQYLNMQVQKFGPTAGLAAYNAGPGRVSQAMQGGPPIPTATQGYVNRGMAMAGGQPGGGQPSGGGPGDGYMAQARQMMQQAMQITAQQNSEKFGLGQVMTPGDPAAMNEQAKILFQKGMELNANPQIAGLTRQAESNVDARMKPGIAGATVTAEKSAALPFAGPMAEAEAQGKANVALRTEGPIERAKTIAHGVQPTTDRFGNMYQMQADGTMKFIGRGSEVKQVWDKDTGRNNWGEVGGVGVGSLANLPGGASANGGGTGVAAEPGPGEKAGLEGAAKVQEQFMLHDNKMVDEDLAHVIENVTPAKQQLFQLRQLNPDANPGAAGDLRMNFKNWVQTFAPDFASQVVGDASPAQEFKKIALMGAGKQERGDLGARGGFRAMELYLSANPSLENQPTANHDMANALLISHQYHEDYARGATDFFNGQTTKVQQEGTTKNYQKVSKYDQEFIGKMRPELYATAISAMNGKPYQEWSKGLSPKQMQIVGGILQRTDPSATVDLAGHQVPVAAFKTTIGPQDIMGSR